MDTDDTSNTFTVFAGQGNGTFGPPVTYRVGYSANALAIGDLNGDGRTDLAVANQTSNLHYGVSIFLGGFSTTTALTVSPLAATLGQQVTLTATVSASTAVGKVVFYNGTSVPIDSVLNCKRSQAGRG